MNKVSFNKIGLIAALALVTLYAANFASSLDKRKVLVAVPGTLLGTWHSIDGEQRLHIAPKQFIVKRAGNTDKCVVTSATIFYGGAFFLSYLFGNPKVAILCDEKSTKAIEHGAPFEIPDSYRKRYIIDLVEQNGCSDVDFTAYLSMGYEGSEGASTWTLGCFSKF